MPNIVYNEIILTGKGDRVAELASLFLGKTKPIIYMSNILREKGISDIDTDYDEKFYQLYQEQLSYLESPKSDSEHDTITFSKLIPMPAKQYIDLQSVKTPTDFLNEPYDVFKNGWYGWGVNHWGTKWDAFDGDVDGLKSDIEYAMANPDQDCSITILFNTAWCHPNPIFDKLVQVSSGVHLSFHAVDEFGVLMCNKEIDTIDDITKDDEIIKDNILDSNLTHLTDPPYIINPTDLAHTSDLISPTDFQLDDINRLKKSMKFF